MIRDGTGKRALAALAAVAVAAGCTAQAPDGPRGYAHPELGIALTLPEGWRMYGEEAKSSRGTLLNWQVRSLEGADRAFLAGLPDSIVPQLQGWTRHFFGSYRDERLGEATVGGVPARTLTHVVTVPRQRTPSTVRYWVVRQGEGLYMIRVVYPPGLESEEDPGVRAILSSWRFTQPTGPLPG